MPGAAVCGQDMIFDMPYIADWKSIGQCREDPVNQDNQHEIDGRVHLNYAIGQKVLFQQEGIHNKEWAPYLGSYF